MNKSEKIALGIGGGAILLIGLYEIAKDFSGSTAASSQQSAGTSNSIPTSVSTSSTPTQNTPSTQTTTPIAKSSTSISTPTSATASSSLSDIIAYATNGSTATNNIYAPSNAYNSTTTTTTTTTLNETYAPQVTSNIQYSPVYSPTQTQTNTYTSNPQVSIPSAGQGSGGGTAGSGGGSSNPFLAFLSPSGNTGLAYTNTQSPTNTKITTGSIKASPQNQYGSGTFGSFSGSTISLPPVSFTQFPSS